ncbi:UNVERIFIED_CONTAM: hypothetical protein ABIC26_001638 [Paenibacillus sp. PvR008]
MILAHLVKTHKRNVRNVQEYCLFSTLSLNIQRMLEALARPMKNHIVCEIPMDKGSEDFFLRPFCHQPRRCPVVWC